MIPAFLDFLKVVSVIANIVPYIIPYFKLLLAKILLIVFLYYQKKKKERKEL